MAVFIYRCPSTGLNVQGWTADLPAQDEETFEPVKCALCARVHLVNPKTTKVVGADANYGTDSR
jgi:hypothetical protein